jgi:hypothetical protein
MNSIVLNVDKQIQNHCLKSKLALLCNKQLPRSAVVFRFANLKTPAHCQLNTPNKAKLVR